jgi:hypothetical protein
MAGHSRLDQCAFVGEFARSRVDPQDAILAPPKLILRDTLLERSKRTFKPSSLVKQNNEADIERT